MRPQVQAMLQQAIQNFQSGNFDKAQSILKRVLQNDSNSADAIFELSIAYAKASRFIEALAIFYFLQSYTKDDFRISYNLGLIHSLRGEHQLALEAYDVALKIQPDDVETLINKGSTCNDIKNYALALEVLEQAIRIKPDIPEAWSNKGIALNNLNLYEESLSAHNTAIHYNPSFVEAWLNKSIPLLKLKRYAEASEACDKALKLKPDYAEANFNKGNVLNELKRYDEAIAHYDKALSLKPDYHEAWSNKGFTLNELKRYDEAIAHYDKALSLKPDYHEASWNKSLCLLSQGDFQNGLPLYESRWSIKKVSEVAGKRLFDKPTWLGVESLQGKTILLYGEQGLGDFIQFCRYTKAVADLGSKVILEVPTLLASLMENLEGVSQLVIQGKELPFFDYQCPLLSLPLALNTRIYSIPANIPYITVCQNKVAEWKLRLGEKRKKRIGLVWSSMSDFSDDSKRSLMLSDFIKALPLEEFEYICLQKELKDCDKEFFQNYKNIRFFGDEFADFSDTAALIENLDLVISTCTSVPHLSAALGKETWILLSHVPDWRWLLDREDSPWYPSIKLYRQVTNGEWVGVLDKVKADLNAG
jgi:hypothetical protein